ncbi:VIT1/CCC1 family predicted Fe2+/Mn2+ transporter [Georgenia soli]|uniref:VIT1/CCC1 family predicted Fe2+/Mn2+ transporter n=1 Tax=Georgenia soli TaxID=638953 RepID=A0A2A9EKH4_9MICO|nr:VIT1/CCC1 transporter family protein [Georgenia soli]PFG39444.1 VIT1/CCC1 family predicted Fe2+/Mn2+ transporter [Georgenia soli]
MNELHALQDQTSGAATPDAVPAGSVVGVEGDRPARREEERRRGGLEQRLNALRAGVLGANDGIVSTAAVVVGVAGATTSTGAIATAGVAAAIGGAVSMALGEYVSVSSQRDSEKNIIEEERRALEADPAVGLESLARLYEERGLSPETSRTVAQELSARDALDAHLRARHNIDATDVASPWHAALASFLAFAGGALLPLLAILLPPPELRVPVTFVGTLVGLALTGAVAAGIGGGSRSRAATRVVVGGGLALAATYLIGFLLGTTGIV